MRLTSPLYTEKLRNRTIEQWASLTRPGKTLYHVSYTTRAGGQEYYRVSGNIRIFRSLRAARNFIKRQD